ncbi:MAG: DUF1844 domain-containing protein [Planctomycetota bacterium]
MPPEENDEKKPTWSKEAGQELPEASFKVHLSAMASQALIHLGQVPHPGTGETKENLPQAKFIVDMMRMLKDKTRGNLDASEEAFLSHLLTDLSAKLK